MLSRALLAAILLIACTDSTGPSRALPVGTYAYSNSNGLTGTFTVTTSDEAGLTATWDVRDSGQRLAFRDAADVIGWNDGDFVVLAQPAQIRFGTHTHRLRRNGAGIACTGVRQAGAGPFTCTLR
jgi:major membrane immunogen (membrane-anchored lipoprotein)